MTRCLSTRRSEDGWVLVIAIAVMAIMLGVGLATLATVDTQSKVSGHERVRESAFNLSDGLLQAESVVLQNNWPTTAPCTGNAITCGYTDNCTDVNAAANPNQCPAPTNFAGASAAFSNVDQQTGATWKIEVRDDVGASTTSLPIYDQPTVNAAQASCGNAVCTWDQNANNQMWVRVEATTRGKKRAVVGLLRLENFNLDLSANAVSGGAVNFKNGGNKTIVDATASQSSQSPGVVVRCQPTAYTHLTAAFNANANPATASVTAGDGNKFGNGDWVAFEEGTSQSSYEILEVQSSASGTITFKSAPTKSHPIGAVVAWAPDPNRNNCEQWTSPNPPTVNGATKAQLNLPYMYHSDPNYPNLMTEGVLQLAERGAIVYESTCPSNSNWSGKIVIKVAPAGGCAIPVGTYNDKDHPGLVIVEDQTPAGGCGGHDSGPALELKGGVSYFGLIYMVNKQCATVGDDPILSIDGNAQVQGAVAIDGNGQVEIGQSQGGNANCTIQTPNLECPTIFFDPKGVAQISASGAAGLVQNTWRELAPGQ